MDSSMTQHVYTLFSLAVLAACSSPLPLRVSTGDQHGTLDELPRVVVDACDTLGLVCEATDDERGAITVDLIRTDDDIKGRRGGTWCEPWVWADPAPVYIAHELGHALGLDHRDDVDAVMHPSPSGFEMTAVELDAVIERAEYLLACG